MELPQILVLLLTLVAFAGAGAFVYVLRGSTGTRQMGMRGLMPSANPRPSAAPGYDDEVIDIDDIKRRAGTASAKTKTEDVTTKLFRAGFYSPLDRQRFYFWRMIIPCLSVPLLFGLMFLMSKQVFISTIFGVAGVFIGYALPLSWLERKVRARQEETLYYLPLVIEQISIGVSSSLDIGPCISEVIRMAAERDKHNPITEMFVHVEKLMRSGLNLETALVDVGEVNGQTEVKHAFMFLAQCSKHGGEVSKQLQELADSVMVQRQVFIEGRIASLPVKATGPLAMVFAGFFALLFAGLMVKIMEAFGGN
jgi:tight adherence protein C